MQNDPEEPLVECAVSGEMHPLSRMLPFGDQWVAPEHKETFIQQLAEGGDVRITGLFTDYRFRLGSVCRNVWAVWKSNLVGSVVFSLLVFGLPLVLVRFLLRGVLGYDSGGWVDDSAKGVFDLFCGSFMFAGIHGTVSRCRDRVSKFGLSVFFNEGRKNFRFVFLTNFVLTAAILSLLAILVLSVELLEEWASEPAASIGSLILILPCFFVGAFIFNRLVISIPLAALEQRKAISALRHSWLITKGKGWRLIWYRLVIYLSTVGVCFVILAGISVPIRLATSEETQTLTLNLLMPVAFVGVSGALFFEGVLALHLSHEAKPESKEPNSRQDQV